MTMSSEHGTDGIANTLAERTWELIRADRIEELAGVFAPDAEMSIAAMSGKGIDYIKGVMGRHLKSYPDVKHELLSVIESPGGTSACREVHFSGTHAGELRNPQTGEVFPPSGKTIGWHAAEVVETADGKITVWHAYFDRMEIAQQLRETDS
jgi:predicted ester cyclase